MKKNILSENMRRFGTKNLNEQEWKSSIRRQLDGPIDYKTIEDLKDPQYIYDVINDSINHIPFWELDNEAPVEAAFMAIEKGGPELYAAVNNIYLNSKRKSVTENSILEWIKSEIDITKIYHKKSIMSMAAANGWK